MLSSLIVVFLTVILPNVAGLKLMPNNPIEIIFVWVLLCLMYFACIEIFCHVKIKTWIKVAILIPNTITLPAILVLIATFLNTLIFTESVYPEVYEEIPYSIVVRKDDDAQEAEDIANYNVEMLKGIDEPGIHSTLQVKTDWKYTTLYSKGGLEQLATDLTDGKAQAMVIRQERLNYLNNNIDGFQDNTKTIYEFRVESKSYKIGNEVSLPNSFAIYINSFESPGNIESMMGKSNVNLLMVVNRQQKKALFVNIPGDYYVQFVNMYNMRDEFSSSSLYGIEESVETVEQLYDIDVNFYVSIDLKNINDIINQLGGIEITSRDSNNESQQIVEAIIKKLIGTDALRRNYGNILQAMDGNFHTDIPNKTLMMALVYQIIAKHDWQFESITAEGENEALAISSQDENSSLDKDYNSNEDSDTNEESSAYVLKPDEKSVSDIKEKIKNLISGN